MIKNLDSPLTVFRHELNHFIFTFYNLIWVLCTDHTFIRYASTRDDQPTAAASR